MKIPKLDFCLNVIILIIVDLTTDYTLEKGGFGDRFFTARAETPVGPNNRVFSNRVEHDFPVLSARDSSGTQDPNRVTINVNNTVLNYGSDNEALIPIGVDKDRLAKFTAKLVERDLAEEDSVVFINEVVIPSNSINDLIPLVENTDCRLGKSLLKRPELNQAQLEKIVAIITRPEKSDVSPEKGIAVVSNFCAEDHELEIPLETIQNLNINFDYLFKLATQRPLDSFSIAVGKSPRLDPKQALEYVKNCSGGDSKQKYTGLIDAIAENPIMDNRDSFQVALANKGSRFAKVFAEKTKIFLGQLMA